MMNSANVTEAMLESFNLWLKRPDHLFTCPFAECKTICSKACGKVMPDWDGSCAMEDGRSNIILADVKRIIDQEPAPASRQEDSVLDTLFNSGIF